MRYIIGMTALLVLASCGTPATETPTIPENDQVISTDQETLDQINEQSQDLDQTVDNGAVVVEAPYTSPSGAVDMKITYVLDENDIVESISATSTAMSRVPQLNEGIQRLVGKNISE